MGSQLVVMVAVVAALAATVLMNTAKSETAGAATATGAPVAPPVAVCGNAGLLDGPVSPPAGAVSVLPGQNLNDVTMQRPAGTTFWLAPGVHTLGSSEYGQVIPKDNNVYIGAPGAVLDGLGVNRFAFTQHARGVRISHLTIRNFVAPQDQGVVNHDSGDDWTIEYSTITNNKGAALMAGARNQIRYNCLADNGQYAINAYQAGDGIVDLVVDHNEIARNNTSNLEVLQPGCGCTGGIKFWAVRGAKVTNNWVHHNYSVGIWADTNNTDFLIEGNYINNNDAEAIFYEISYNAIIRNNTIVANTVTKGKEFAARGDSFPVASVYLSEVGGDARQQGPATIEVANNTFDNNWAGVTLWENADRFCGSPANTSSGYCTAVNPSATLNTCTDPAQGGLIATQPYLSDCRWKTQNVNVHDNDFRFDRAAVGCTTNHCGLNAILSNHGTYPTWSPYKGRTIQDAITHNQNNRFTNNRYSGHWKFNPYEMNRLVDLTTWQTTYNQDRGSRTG